MKDYDTPYALTRVRPHYDYTRLYGSYALTCAESFLAQRGRVRPYVYWCALLMVAVLLTALPLVKVDLTVQEFGRIRPATERSTIVARTAGFIASLKVHDNEIVHAGDTLAVLNMAALTAKFDLNASETKLRNIELADLRALIEAATAKRPVTVTNLQTAEYIAEYQQFDTLIRDAGLKMDRSAREMNRTKDLLARKVVAAKEADEAIFTANEARTGLDNVYKQSLAKWEVERVKKTTELDSLKAEARQLEELRELYYIKAPIGGAVIGLTGIVEGSYVQAGQGIGDISPTSDFVFDVSVPPKDVGRLYKGQAARLQIDAYPYTVWGLLNGEILSISADYVHEGENNGGFKVIVRPESETLRTREGLEGTLRKGMTGNARFFIARRTLLELFYESMDKLFNPVHKERPTNEKG
jgi:membrane fusion protein, peptide pheromone/bacteriocin exporter